MKAAFALLCLALIGCAQKPDPELSALSSYYAQKGEKMTPTSQRVEQRNPKPGTPETLNPVQEKSQ